MTTPTESKGWWARLRGDRDAVAEQLNDLARQGSGMARLAHLFATVMVVLFSAGSLVALSGDALTASLATLHAGGVPRVPDVISIGVSTALVLCCDVGMLYAATVIRVARTRGATDNLTLHYVVMIGVAAIEASTYLFMSYRYESPVGWAAWAIISARAASAPALAIYLSMARALPVTAADVLRQAELAQGIELVKDVVRVAQDPTAPLADKMALYSASAQMRDADRTRLEAMIAVVRDRLAKRTTTDPLDDPPGIRPITVADTAAPTGDVPTRDYTGAGVADGREGATPAPVTLSPAGAAVDAPEPPDDDPPPDPPAPTRPARRGKASAATRADGNGHERTAHLALVPYTPDLPGGEGREGFPNGAVVTAKGQSARRGKRMTPADLKQARKASRRAALEAQAVAILDDKPDTTKEALRAILHVRQQTANELHAHWLYSHRAIRRRPLRQ